MIQYCNLSSLFGLSYFNNETMRCFHFFTQGLHWNMNNLLPHSTKHFAIGKCVCSVNTSLTILCWLTRFFPLNNSESIVISYMEPQPPAENDKYFCLESKCISTILYKCK